MFPIESSYGTVLFDSGATHSFIADSFIAQNGLPITLMKNPMVISTPGAQMKTRKLCPKVNINIRGVDFPSSLIVLESKGLDIIFGMDWLGKLMDMWKQNKCHSDESSQMLFCWSISQLHQDQSGWLEHSQSTSSERPQNLFSYAKNGVLFGLLSKELW